jgi:hypothetical protein
MVLSSIKPILFLRYADAVHKQKLVPVCKTG